MMGNGGGRFRRALAAFDRANAEDPNTECVEGVEQPKELVYARRMTAWLHRFDPQASEPLQLAARSQHIRRWTVPRSDYPPGRSGYRRWRTDLAQFHAETAGVILKEEGYDTDTINRVQKLLRKEGLKRDPEVQTLEDVVCLVFLESYFTDFASRQEQDKLVGIIRKTLRKMSPRGREQALSLPLEPEAQAIVKRAVAKDSDLPSP